MAKTQDELKELKDMNMKKFLYSKVLGQSK